MTIKKINYFLFVENYESGAEINLDSNQLTFLDPAVFQSIVTGFRDKNYSSATTFITAAKSNQSRPFLEIIQLKMKLFFPLINSNFN